ncbi:MAG TPA: GNAT family N-acetyltransferase [Actinomycetota bacterium]|jgi:RimJ/RimL family protein N-acetyltransferase|nr:GNAT family N-acetyltransferase [Actinomycetota bacterium]
MHPFQFIRESVTLRDGRAVLLRPIDAKDGDRLIDLHNSLSFDSQYFRFFGPKPRLTKAEATYLASVDFAKRFAIVAEIKEERRKRLVGVGRFDVNEPGVAEAAIVVRDDYQGVGLGSALLERMREVGRGAGLDAFTAEVLAENQRMLDLLERNGLEFTAAQGGVVRVMAPLDQPALFKGLKVAAQFAGTIIQRLPGQSRAD